jgi:hypothetical protein
MKKRNNNFKFSNRLNYTLITLGIFVIAAVAVYATTGGVSHSVGEIDWSQIIPGPISVSGEPTSSSHVTTKGYVDEEISKVSSDGTSGDIDCDWEGWKNSYVPYGLGGGWGGCYPGPAPICDEGGDPAYGITFNCQNNKIIDSKYCILYYDECDSEGV